RARGRGGGGSGGVRSCIYTGSVRHRRLEPSSHDFRYRLFMLYLDLGELPGVFDGRWLWSARRPAPAGFRRADYLGDPAVPLDEAVRREAERRIGRRPAGPVRVLTHLRYFGYVMNPVTFYYCFSEGGERVETILAEITNTPWNERHTYALRPGPDGAATDLEHRFGKAFHVSPFMDMDHRYAWRFAEPGESLSVHMENAVGGAKVFEATLLMRRRELTGPALAAVLVRFPWMTARVALGIYWQAARLWLKRTPFHVHPAKRGGDVAEPAA
ncbi:MAG TPA: DUF1365 domain-containing protein, partial [Longimicrobiales bacterium]|nr:DUF1365 domain-containing protein [Longimicrobiales bacterium]